VVGASAFCRGIADGEAALLELEATILARGPAASASLADVRRSDAVVVLGEDPTMTAPVLALALRQAALVAPGAAAPRDIPRWHDAAVREWIGTRRGPFFIASPLPTRLDDVATRSVRLDAGAAAELAQAVARELAQGGTAAAGGSRGAAGASEIDRLAADIAAALAAAERPLIVAGTAGGSRELLDSAAALATACGERARIALTAPESNSLGTTLLGGTTLESAFAAIERGEVETLIVLENDLYRRAPRARVDDVLARVPHLIVLDHFLSRTARRAELVLPAATFAEGDGTLVSSEGRAQRYFQVCPPRAAIAESWRWLGEGAGRAGLRAAGPWPDIAAVASALALEHRALARAGELAAAEEEPPGARPLARQSHRWSGRTAILADRTVHEPAPPTDPDSPFVFSMEGQPSTSAPGRLLPFYWWPRWNSVQSLNKFQEEVGGALRGGEAGVRLLEPGDLAPLPATTASTAMARPGSSPAGAAPDDSAPSPGRVKTAGIWRIVAAPQIFGSEELSAAAPAIAERTPKPFVLLGTEDAETLAGGAGGTVEVWVGGETMRLPVVVEPALARGMAALPVGLPGLPWIALPATGEVRKP
jgi:NADH-quinone oxidoreductase subunit G